MMSFTSVHVRQNVEAVRPIDLLTFFIRKIFAGVTFVLNTNSCFDIRQ